MEVSNLLVPFVERHFAMNYERSNPIEAENLMPRLLVIRQIRYGRDICSE